MSVLETQTPGGEPRHSCSGGENHFSVHPHPSKYGEVDGHGHGQTDGQTDRQTDRRTHTDTHLVEGIHESVNVHGDLSVLEALHACPTLVETGGVWHEAMVARTEWKGCALQGDSEIWLLNRNDIAQQVKNHQTSKELRVTEL